MTSCKLGSRSFASVILQPRATVLQTRNNFTREQFPACMFCQSLVEFCSRSLLGTCDSLLQWLAWVYELKDVSHNSRESDCTLIQYIEGYLKFFVLDWMTTRYAILFGLWQDSLRKPGSLNR